MSKIIDFPTGKKREKRAKAIRARRNKEAQQRSEITPSKFWWVIAALLFLVVEYRNDWHYTQSALHAAAIFVSLFALRIGHDKLLNGLIRLKSYLSRKG